LLPSWLNLFAALQSVPSWLNPFAALQSVPSWLNPFAAASIHCLAGSICLPCVVFNKFGSTAINCPRSLQILYCQKMLFCTLQRIYSSVAIFLSLFNQEKLAILEGIGLQHAGQ
jgi:hypothetical protein